MNSTKDSKKQQRQFYLMVGVGLVLLGAWRIYRAKTMGPGLIGFGTILVAIEFLIPPLAGAIFRKWMAFAKVLGTVNTYLLVSILYFAMFVPIGLLRRLSSKSYGKILTQYRKTRSSWTHLEPGVPSRESYLNPY